VKNQRPKARKCEKSIFLHPGTWSHSCLAGDGHARPHRSQLTCLEALFPFYLLPTRVLILSPIRIPWMLCFLWLYKGHPSLVKSSSLALYTFLHINKVISFIFYCVLSLVLFSLCLLFIVRTWVVHHHLWVMESNP
jgi:hypothetical protein